MTHRRETNDHAPKLTAEDKRSLVERATDIAAEGIIITDARHPANPIIYANDGFVRLTGYAKEYVMGKNCRFLQGDDTDEGAIDEIRSAIAGARRCTVELLNYKKDGTPFWNRLSITPLKDARGRTTHFVGVQSDITELKNTKEKLEAANIELRKFHQEMTVELEQAKRAQAFILPQKMPSSPFLTIVSKYEPLAPIGGDFFDIVTLSEDTFGVLIADVTGHGIPAALLTFMSANTFKNISPGIFSTQTVLTRTNNLLRANMPIGTFVTMYYVIYNAKTRELCYTQAGHPPALLIKRSSGEVQQLTTSGTTVGVFPTEKAQFGEGRTQLEAGDKLLLYTDAFIEVMNGRGEELEMHDLITFLKQKRALPIADLIEEMYAFGLTFSGKERYRDDATLLGLEVIG